MLKVITAATVEPVTLAEAKTFLRVDTDADDTLIGALISAAREFAEHYTQATLAATVYELALDAFPLDAIDLPNASNAEDVSVKYTDTAGVEQTISPAAYVVSDYGMTAHIYPLDLWPVVGDYPNAVRVRYTASPAIVPATAKAAVLELLAHLYENRDKGGPVPPGVLRLLDVSKVYG